MSAAAAPAGGDTPTRVRRSAVVALLGAVVAFSLLQSMVVPALPQIRAELRTSVTGSSWVISAFLLTSSFSAILLGRLGDMFGKKRWMLVSLAALVLGSALAAVSPSIGVLIAARAVQGLGAATFPLSYGLVREMFAGDRVPVVIGVISSTFGIGFAVGLVVPGPLIPTLGWHGIFWLSVLVDGAALILVALAIPESRTRARGRIDGRGAAALAVALTAGLLAISQSRAWPPLWELPLAAVGVAAFVLFVQLQLRTPDPLVQLRLLRIRAVAAADLVAFIVGFGLYGAFNLIPQFAQTSPTHGYGYGADSTQAGLLLLPTALAMLIAGPAAGRLGTRFGFSRTLVVACVLGLLGYLVLLVGLDSAIAMVVGTTVLGLGIGFSFTSVVNLVVGAVEPAFTGQASGVNTIVRTAGGSLGAQVTAAILAASAGSASGLPTETGYRVAFSACMAALAVAAVATFALTRRARARA